MKKDQLLEQLKGGLVVSCQALEDEPMYSESGGIMPKFAKAAQLGGAVGIRANGIRDIKEIKELVNLPIIGIIKKEYEGSQAYITPTMVEVDALVKLGTDIIATDFTSFTRANGLSAYEFVLEVKKKYPDIILMADCATLDNAMDAEKAGVDFIGTTMSGYTDDSESTEGPNIKYIREILENCKTPVIAEGRIHYPDQAKEILQEGAFCVVVGGAITRPLEITQRFFKAIKDAK